LFCIPKLLCQENSHIVAVKKPGSHLAAMSLVGSKAALANDDEAA
jgi:hypothetical protein